MVIDLIPYAIRTEDRFLGDSRRESVAFYTNKSSGLARDVYTNLESFL